MIVKHTNHVITSFVADPFVPDLVRFHCPIVTVLKFNKPKISTYKRRIWLYDRGEFNTYRNIINTTNWENIFQSEDLDSIAISISDLIIDAASKTIPNTIATIRPTDIPWFNSNLRKSIRKRNRIHKKAKAINTEYMWAKYKEIS